MVFKNIVSTYITVDNFDYVLFKTAIYFAEYGYAVWLISPYPIDKIPKCVKPPSKEILQLLTFIYLRDYKDLISHLNKVHLWRKLPDMIIVNNFESYCDLSSSNFNITQTVLLISSLLDTISTCSRKINKGKCFLLVLSKLVSNNNFKTLVDLYFSNVVTICKDQVENIIDIMRCMLNQI